MSVSIPSQVKSRGSCWNEAFNSTLSVSVKFPPFLGETVTYHFLCVGQTGLGKSTLINTIFAAHLIDSKGRLTVNEPVRQTTEIQAVSHGNTYSSHYSLWYFSSSDWGKRRSSPSQHRRYPRIWRPNQ
jgi:ABC-type phosphonate transport system ATPase subunit